MATNFNSTTPAAPGGNTNVAWQTDGSGNLSGYVPTGLSNPMTTLGDIITGGSSGTPGRLAIGSTGQVLTVAAGAPAWAAAAGGGGAMVQIAQTVVGSPVATVTFSGIAGTYSALQLQIIGRSSGAVNQDNLVVKANTDTTSVYSAQFAEFDNASSIIVHAVSAAPASCGPASLPGSSATANTAGIVIGDFVGYASTSFFKNAHFRSGFRDSSAAVTHEILTWWEWASTAALTRLDLTLSSGGNFVAGSVISLYGIT